MQYTEKHFYLCRIPLTATGASDVEVIAEAQTTDEFPTLYSEFESKRKHALNKDGLYGVVRAEELYAIVRTAGKDLAKSTAFEEQKANLVTNLQHRVMQKNDAQAKQILSKVHEIETAFGS